MIYYIPLRFVLTLDLRCIEFVSNLCGYIKFRLFFLIFISQFVNTNCDEFALCVTSGCFNNPRSCWMHNLLKDYNMKIKLYS